MNKEFTWDDAIKLCYEISKIKKTLKLKSSKLNNYLLEGSWTEDYLRTEDLKKIQNDIYKIREKLKDLEFYIIDRRFRFWKKGGE